MGRFLLALVAGLASIQVATAQTSVTTDPVGFVQPFNSTPNAINLLANSDTLVSVPFVRPPAFTGAIASISGNVITVSGSPGWTTSPQQFVYAQGSQPNHYYALIGPGTSNPKEGHFYNITGNGSNTLTVDTTNDNLTGIPANAQVVILPHLTLGTVFPSTDANVSYTPTTQTRTFKTEILIPNFSPTGQNPSASAAYFYSNNVNGTTGNVGWRIVGDNTTPHDDDVLTPYGYFIVRNQNGAAGGVLTTVGSVLTKKFVTPELTSATQIIDNSVTMVRPIGVTLNNTGLGPADNSFVATTQTRSFKDELFVFDNTVASFNKSASAAYFYSNNVNGTTNNVGWRVVGDNTTDHGGDLIAPGSALVIRKAANGTGGTIFWTNAPTY
jgi:uncharacterized protein (TIGR02597 family)